MNQPRPDRTATQWGRFDQAFTSTVHYLNPVQEAQFTVTFTSPTGAAHAVDGFWDGATTWRVRFMPDTEGAWSFVTHCSDPANAGLHARSGAFWCTPADPSTRFGQHGSIRVAPNRRYFEHADGTPFFWLADTCWSGPLQSSGEEWEDYLRTRVRQQFNAVQWLGMQFLAAPHGDCDGQMAFAGHEQVAVNAAFFRRLDARIDALNRAGLLAVPALLWAAHWSTPAVNGTNPGFTLPESQCILLARYMVARWGAHHVAWILPGDAEYRGENAARWKRIGQAVFGGRPHAPVTLHPGGGHWYGNEFRDEAWLDFIGYQSGHASAKDWLGWIPTGEPATAWQIEPARPIINLEPNYEYHLDQSDRTRRFDAFDVRRAVYWSLLASPTAGVTYGGHGVWGWDDGTRPPVNHPNTGVPLPWRQALTMPGAEQMAHVAELFGALPWWRLRPAPELVAVQPGEQAIGRHITASRTDTGDVAVFYTPHGDAIELILARVAPSQRAVWFDPRTGKRVEGVASAAMTPPSAEDWVLLLLG